VERLLLSLLSNASSDIAEFASTLSRSREDVHVGTVKFGYEEFKPMYLELVVTPINRKKIFDGGGTEVRGRLQHRQIPGCSPLFGSPDSQIDDVMCRQDLC